MSSSDQNPPSLASLRGGRRRARSSTADDPRSQQSSLTFTAPAKESAPSPEQARNPGPSRQVEHRILTVGALVSQIRGQVEVANDEVWVEGEISNCRPAPSGHIYLTLKDASAQLPVVLFRRQVELLRFRPADGLAVLVRGRISVYESRGQLQLIAEIMEPRGAGSLQLAFEQLKVRLTAEGLFEESRKRPLPAFPRCIGIISSPSGAVIRDIITVVRRRHAPLNLLLYPAVMQGASSPSSVVRAIRWFNANPQYADLILIARGGGSLEDLACFNDESLARIIAASGIPVVSAIGHETDFTIADFVADLRAPTPSAAAEMITAAQHRIEDRVVMLDHRLRRGIRLHLLEARQRYSRLAAATVLERVSAGIDRRSQRVDELALRLDRAVHRRHRYHAEFLRALIGRLQRQNVAIKLAASRRRLDRSTTRLEQLVAAMTLRRSSRLNTATRQLQALSPLSVLARGYALVYSADGTLLREATQAKTGEAILARLATGIITAQVTVVEPKDTHADRSTEYSRTLGEQHQMKKLFGTDGIRSVAGQYPLDPPTVYAIGLALAHHLGASPRVILGMDTRESGPAIAATLTAGLDAGGASVENAGVITTPGVAYLARTHGFAAGIVISASHNPWQDNGIKVFGGDGYKLPDATELAIEDEIFRILAQPSSTGAPTAWANPAAIPVNEADRADYIRFLLAAVPNLSLEDRRIVIDCANGAASSVAAELFAQLNGHDIVVTHASPDGRNINENCGALHPEIVAGAVKHHKAQLGITFDGDADRALFADELGRVVNGDAVLLLAARDLAARGLLTNSTVVATTMSNMGLEAALKRSGIRMLRANVGDKYVLEQMLATHAALGGEQSGHIIFSGRSTTGDGLLTALLLLDIVYRAGKPLSELISDLKVFPQVIVNVKVREKRPLEGIPTVASAITTAERELADSGRVVIRYSGTEALARVMIEAESENLMRHHAEAIATAIRTELGL